ncbi:HTH-type transcriptional regulator CynR [Antarctobacter heliothermus]|uniref:HTH-type transcriptional regulator CynR n=1 Tax=Antarctobacter heliothermus TaxID=74033 RepID=A0A222E0F7_9RHOB|nr:LysR substrate-binding domain-containing protein [Antarctobacter heliothermus]ASP19458.1 HTH-type transcriptional regulator CynR [Antarctobacter heliothermus]MBT54886.1 LysR family transcriptional regulator [Mameliella sp.]|tara:strand:+ start:5732 stop:6709 length:978 start_codon:yes stop_codon:yes gene_type:complete
MDIRQLRYFVRIVEMGSLSKASQSLHVAQPALSQQVAKLEDQVGKQLLVRSSRGVTPNETGRALYHHARLILRQFEQAMTIARSDNGEITGVASVGLPATTVAAVGLPLVKRVREKYPGISLNVVEAMSGHVAHLIRQNRLDLAVLFSRDLPSDLSVEPLMVEELFLILPGESDLLSGRDSVTMSEMAKVPLVLPTSDHGLRKRIEAEFESRALFPNVVAEIDSLSLVMNAVHDKIGGTIKPMGAIMQEGQRGRSFRCLRVSDASFHRSNYLYSLPPNALSSAASVVAHELRIVVEDLVASSEWTGFFPRPEPGDRPPASSREIA